MSSVVIWRDEATGVTASWNKQGPHTVFVPLRIDDQGICDGTTTEWRGEKAAIRAAEFAAKARLKDESAGDPAHRRYRVIDRTDASSNRAHELRELAWFGHDRRFDAAAVAMIGTLPVGGTFESVAESRTVTVQRVR